MESSTLSAGMRLANLILACLLGCSTAAQAEDKAETTWELTLEECVQLALENNLDLRIERHNPQIMRYTLDAAYGVYDPELRFSAVRRFVASPGGVNPATLEPFPARETTTERFGPGIGGVAPTGLQYDLSGELVRTDIPGREYTGQAGITLRQPLLRDLWIDQGRRTIQVRRRDLQISEAGFELQLMSVITRVELAYYDLIFARESVKVFEAAHVLAERLVHETRRRVEVGALAPLDEKQSESQFAATRADLIAARQELMLQQNRLKDLLTDDFMAWHDVEIVPAETLLAIPQRFDLWESWHRGLSQRPDLAQLRLDLERRDIDLRYRRNQLYPSVDLVGSYGHNALDRTFGGALDDTRRGQTPFHSYGVILSVPLSNRIPRSNYRATREEREQAKLILRRLEQDVLVAIDDAVKQAQMQLERVEATRQARLFAEAALDAEQKKLQAGQSTSFIVLQLQRDLTAARSAEIRALADYNQALSRLALEEGETLENYRLEMNVQR